MAGGSLEAGRVALKVDGMARGTVALESMEVVETTESMESLEIKSLEAWSLESRSPAGLCSRALAGTLMAQSRTTLDPGSDLWILRSRLWTSISLHRSGVTTVGACVGSFGIGRAARTNCRSLMFASRCPTTLRQSPTAHLL